MEHNDPGHPCFHDSLFQFLRELRIHNDREWFQANKTRFESEVREPVLAFIMAFADPRPVGGSMFRIFRDTRFLSCVISI